MCFSALWGVAWPGKGDAIISNGHSDCMILFADCGTEDEEEVGPTPSPGYSDSHVPVSHESSRTG